MVEPSPQILASEEKATTTTKTWIEIAALKLHVSYNTEANATVSRQAGRLLET